ncbi:TetR/AcrR family transcriptional regulator [Aquirhabdus parva]|uniref:TetR/AcrR family transcriptional regulator n=1 Tax=Aquirhabdus parva TaxID=2283318 RepID=A0A345P3Q6_9GAMM|nr:TetR/AcrR family transcriptional regulator [Aquirhabdus parva]AXI01915.1 TetR/AcrR family transcriptional regulator [Aquirhabdus parva]
MNKQYTSADVAEVDGGKLPNRNAQVTRDRILQTAVREFAEKGYSGVRVEAIARIADINIRMIYHYFVSKEQLYIEVLEYVLSELRDDEFKLNLDVHNIDPVLGILKLYDFTEAHFARNKDLQSLLQSENLNKAIYLKQSKRIQEMSFPILDILGQLIKRGEENHTIRPNINPLHLYTTLVSLSVFHKSNAYTLSYMFDTDLLAPEWQQAHKTQAHEMIKAYLQTK